ncbi:MAG: single-stranded-DNA-specific exonuclease RecJ [Bdellovibrionales bacterium]|nr:single-stranded-DNA-specific exonuclease RecJ [Bdellovibrionales bacterium]
MSTAPSIQLQPRRRSSRLLPAKVLLREDQVSLHGSPGDYPADSEQFRRALGVSEVAARILACRGVCEVDSARAFLAPSLREHLPDPATMKNLPEAADALLDAVEAGSRITVYSDFDVDGLTSSAQLVLFLEELGANVTAYVPNRFVEGYGLAATAVEALARTGTEVLVTLDCGITSIREIALAKRLGLKTFVFDHHLPGAELPAADFVVDPAQPGCPFAEHKLAAAGIVWMLLIMLRVKAKRRADFAAKTLPDPKEYLDLAAIGTICDMVPLQGLNRLIAFRGIEALRQTKRLGLTLLKDISRTGSDKRFGSGHVSFGLGPRINAAGRLGDANDVVTLLTTKDSKRARTVVEAIDSLNDRRRLIEGQVRDACISSLTEQGFSEDVPGIAIYGESFHLGVLGIAAQRLVEEFYRPAAVMGPGEMVLDGKRVKVIKGSVRGIRGFHVADALSSLTHLLVAHGGHAQAGGFTVLPERLDEFQTAFVETAGKLLNPELLRRQVEADIRICLSQVDFELANELLQLAPFGIGNPSPLLVSEQVRIGTVSALQDRHLKVRLIGGNCSRNAVGWNLQGHPLIRKDEVVNVAYHVELNTYQGVSSVQLNLREVWQ